jgi:nucleoside-diphosphate-sugar epimerase
VLGASGFIGRWVARNLSDAGALLTLPVRDRAAASEVLAGYGISGDLHELDLLHAQGLEELFRSVRPAVTFNLAGYGVDRTEQDAVLAYKVNADLIATLCAFVSQNKDGNWAGQDLICAGTAMEYGSAAGDLNERTAPVPTTLYGRSKLRGTELLGRNCEKYVIKGITARLFSIYGPGESAARLLPTLMAAAKGEDQIPLTAGSHKRDFVYVNDAAQSLLRLGLVGETVPTPVNVATGRLTSVRNFAETIADEIGIDRRRLEFGALLTRPEEMDHGPVSNRLLYRLVNRLPATSIVEGVRKTAAFSEDRSSKTTLLGVAV